MPHPAQCTAAIQALGERAEVPLTVQINHAIVAAFDRRTSATFFAEVFGLEKPTEWGPFSTVLLGDGAHLHFAQPPGVTDIQFQHYAFRVDDERFDAIYARVCNLSIEHWADPQMQLPNQVNTNHGGRGVYFRDVAGHFLEVLTRSEVDA